MDLVVTLIQKLISIIFYDIIGVCNDVSPAEQVVVAVYVALIIYIATETPRRLNRRFGLGLRLLIVVSLRPTLAQHLLCTRPNNESEITILMNNVVTGLVTDLGIGKFK